MNESPSLSSVTKQSQNTEDFELDLLLEAIFWQYHFDFRGYSKASIKRRMSKAKKHFGCETYSLLQNRILHECDLMPKLLTFLTVPVSELFRDPLYYKDLRENVLPHLKTYPSINVWTAGCSTGEELYSLVILFREEGLEERTTFYATDINNDSLKKAKLAIYDLEMMKVFSNNYLLAGGKASLSDYYSTAYGAAKLDSSLRKQVVFSEHNLVSDADFAEMHLVSCRNVLIYFEKELQARVIKLFNQSLSRKGFLWLGSKESLVFSPHVDTFSEFLPDSNFYQKESNITDGT